MNNVVYLMTKITLNKLIHGGEQKRARIQQK